VLSSCSLGLEFLDLARLVAGQHIGECNVDPHTLRNALRHALIVSGEHCDVDAASAQVLPAFRSSPLTRKCRNSAQYCHPGKRWCRPKSAVHSYVIVSPRER
jgi:hypothetical protein